LLLLGFFGGFLGYEVIRNLNWAVDWFTAAIVLWNFSIVGLVAIFWHSPVKVNQMYLIAVSVIMALVFTRLPEWTTWAILAAIAIYGTRIIQIHFVAH
jgi:presenilin 1